MKEEITWQLYSYGELSADALYDILALRAEVFIVEQDSVYQDLDYKDQRAYHLVGRREGELVAYSRLFKSGDYYDEAAAIGRFVVADSSRGAALGRELLVQSLSALRELEGAGPIRIMAQQYLQEFYASYGFYTTGEPYMEEGRLHVQMRKDSNP